MRERRGGPEGKGEGERRAGEEGEGEERRAGGGGGGRGGRGNTHNTLMLYSSGTVISKLKVPPFQYPSSVGGTAQQ